MSFLNYIEIPRMTGLVTKKHFFLIVQAFGFSKACKVLFSSQPVALLDLMK